MKIVPNLKKNKQTEYETIFYYAKNAIREKKSLKSQLCIYLHKLHTYFSIVASICFVEMEPCLFVHFS